MGQPFQSSSVGGPGEELSRAVFARLNHDPLRVRCPQRVPIIAFVSVGERPHSIAHQVVQPHLQEGCFADVNRDATTVV